MYRIILIIIFISLSCNALARKLEEAPPSGISAGDIEDFINSERKVLRGKYKVDLPLNFKSKSSVIAERYGNNKKVLNLNELSLSGRDLRGVIFTMANMQGVNLSGSKLQNSDFVYVDFSGADLSEADFSKADLSNANFEGAKLKGANFDGANLFGAQFVKISDIPPSEVKKLKSRTNKYVDLDREPLPDYYNFSD